MKDIDSGESKAVGRSNNSKNMASVLLSMWLQDTELATYQNSWEIDKQQSYLHLYTSLGPMTQAWLIDIKLFLFLGLQLSFDQKLSFYGTLVASLACSGLL